MRQIAPHVVWVGHVGDARDVAGLRAMGIRALVDLAINEAPLTPGREVVYCRWPLVDGAGNAEWLLRAAIESVAVLISAGTPTLVYCSAGMSRSPSVVAGALAVLTRASPEDCLARVVSGGPADVSVGLWVDVCRVAQKSREVTPLTLPRA